MPYRTVPAHLRGLTLAKANRWGAVYDAAIIAGKTPEEAARLAWGAVRRADAAPVRRPPEPRALEREYTRLLRGRTRLLSEHLTAQLAHRMGDDTLSRAEAEDVLGQVRHQIAALLIPRKALAKTASAVGVFADRIADRQGLPRRAAPRRDAATVGTPSIPDALRDVWIRENVDLIGGMQAKWYGEVEAVIREAAAKGTAPKQIARAVSEASGKFGRHAQLIATDQIGKLNSRIAEHRQTSAGIVRYRWSTSRDERVRPTHRILEGTEHDWNDPPISEANGERNHPGRAVRCRCTASPVVAGSPLEGLGLD